MIDLLFDYMWDVKSAGVIDGDDERYNLNDDNMFGKSWESYKIQIC